MEVKARNYPTEFSIIQNRSTLTKMIISDSSQNTILTIFIKNTEKFLTPYPRILTKICLRVKYYQ